MLISEYAKQILLLMYKEELDRPGVSFKTLEVGEDEFSADEKGLVEAIEDVVNADKNRAVQSLEYLEGGGYVSAINISRCLDGSAVYIGVKLTARGVDFAERLLAGDETSASQAGLIINGDVNFSANLESVFKAEATDLTGFGAIVDLLKQFTKK